MKWLHTLWRWSSLGISIAALGAAAFVGKHWAEQHALESVLGPGARTRAMTLHWAYSAGCADNVRIPLSASDEMQTSARLSARRMWFTYDLPALLRKRVILPRIIIEDAHIVSAATPHDAPSPAASIPAACDTEALAWVHELQSRTAELGSERFITGTQVAIDTAMLSEQWQANFADVHNRARRILTEAKDIQQELAAMDNPLRQEAKVLASRGRLEALKNELASLKNSLLKTDKVLREQQSRIREALLAEKRALHETGTAFQSPPALGLAQRTVNGWLTACIAEPAQYSVLLSDLICSPFRHAESTRGSNIRHLDPLTAAFAVKSAKIAGEISLSGRGALSTHRTPFTASGSFQVVPCASTDGALAGDRSRWQMSVGRSLNCIVLEGESRSARANVTKVALESSGPGQVEAKCEVVHGKATGSAHLRLREWLADRADLAAVNQSLSNDALVRELLEKALADLEPAPQELAFEFTSEDGATRVMLGATGTEWLADQLAQAASAHVAEKYEAAIEKLDAHILSELEAVNRSVAVSYNAETQHLQQLLQEIKVLQADVINNLAQRAGTEFARKSGGDTLR